MTLYLQPEIHSGLGEKTFWVWLAEEFPNVSFDCPADGGKPGDAILQYSTLDGPPESWGKNAVALLWELHFEMRLQLESREWNDVIERTERCAAACARRVVSTRFAIPFYSRFGPCDLLPIGVDCELFKPRPGEKAALREQYHIPQDVRVGFWMGTSHRMKGFDRLREHAREHPETFWIIVWKSRRESGSHPPFPCHETAHITQEHLADLMNCSDFLLACGRLRPWFMVEWEAMACNLPVIDVSGLEREFVPSANPRDDVLRLGWDRATAKNTWMKYLGAS